MSANVDFWQRSRPENGCQYNLDCSLCSMRYQSTDLLSAIARASSGSHSLRLEADSWTPRCFTEQCSVSPESSPPPSLKLAYTVLKLTNTEKQQKKVKQQAEAAAKHQAEADQRVSHKQAAGRLRRKWRFGLF